MIKRDKLGVLFGKHVCELDPVSDERVAPVRLRYLDGYTPAILALDLPAGAGKRACEV